MIQEPGRASIGRNAKVNSGLAVSTHGTNKRKIGCSVGSACRAGDCRGDRRRKVINAGTGHDDAVAAAVSFLGDAQESPAVVLAELHVEMLALDLQFSR